MRDHSGHIELSRHDAVAAMLAHVEEACTGVELVAVEESFGRVVAEEVRSTVQMPNCLTCCLDSIAVHWDDFAHGIPDTSQWVRGVDWQFANTGVAMPDGFDTAIVIEHVEVSEDEQSVVVKATPSRRFAGTKPAGAHLNPGDVLAHAGEVITPDTAARIASGNVVSVPVRAKPHVAFIATGNELVKAGCAEVGTGKNIETNSLLVKGRVEEWGGVYVPLGIAPDNPQLICEAVRRACAVADIVVLNAGSSKGSEDWSVEQLDDLGSIICHQTNHGPGHHSSYAVVDGVPVVGISGPPRGASFTLGFYLRPVMRKMLGLDPAPIMLPARLTAPFPGTEDMEQAKKADPKTLPGEARPLEASDTDRKPFHSIKFLHVDLAADGTLEATPADRAGAVNAFHMLPTGYACPPPPQTGDIVLVELH